MLRVLGAFIFVVLSSSAALASFIGLNPLVGLTAEIYGTITRSSSYHSPSEGYMGPGTFIVISGQESMSAFLTITAIGSDQPIVMDSFALNGPPFAYVDHVFTYNTPGTYTISYSYDATFYENYFGYIHYSDGRPDDELLSSFATPEHGAGSLEFTFPGAVPEPSTWAMMLLGFAGIGFMAYRRRQNLSAAV